MSKRIDLGGKKIGEWKVLRLATKEEKQYKPNAYWVCECSCGKIKVVASGSLIKQTSTSCGHANGNTDDLTDSYFGEWYVERKATEQDFERYNITKPAQRAYYLCKCSCGTRRVITSYALRNGNTSSCGHNTSKFKDLTNQKFGLWYVIRRATQKEIEENILMPNKGAYWVCECQCENKTIRIKAGGDLKSGQSKSCGCQSGKTRVLDKNRTLEQIHLMEDRNALKEKLEQFIIDNGRKMNSNELMHLIGASQTPGALSIVRNRRLDDLIEKYVYPDIRSKTEEQIANMVEKWCDSEVKSNVRGIIGAQELDVYIPELNFAVEFNGNYWHSSTKKYMEYHQKKALAAKNKGISIFNIYEYELDDSSKIELLFKILQNKVSKDNIKTVDAYKCNIIAIDNNYAESFEDKYSLNKTKQAELVFGLKYDNEIICIAKFSRQDVWILETYISRYDVKVEKGLRRIVEYFCNLFNCTVYADISLDKEDWKTYEDAGFELIDIKKPQHAWYICNEHRLSTLEEKIELDEMSTSIEDADEELKNFGYLKIFNSGCITYKYNNK